MEICPSPGGKVKLQQKFLRTNDGLIGFEIFVPPSQDTRTAQRTSSWADMHPIVV
jgi:hypothetical protein